MTAYDIVQAAFEQQPQGSLARSLLGKIADMIEDADVAIETGEEA